MSPERENPDGPNNLAGDAEWLLAGGVVARRSVRWRALDVDARVGMGWLMASCWA